MDNKYLLTYLAADLEKTEGDSSANKHRIKTKPWLTAQMSWNLSIVTACDVIIYAIEWPTYPYECNAILYDVNCGEFNEYIRTGVWLGYT